MLRTRLGNSLFPDAPREPPVSKAGCLLIVLGLLALAIFLQLLRVGWSVSLNSLWAEDGPIFLQGGLTHGFGQTLFTPYSKYLVLVQRLIGEVASLVPLRDAPAAVSILSAGVVALSGLVVWHASAGHIRSPYLRGTLVALTILAPVAGLESIDSASYVSWYMLFATFWLLLWRPPTMRATALAALFILTTALSNPGVWFFIPLAALRAVAARDRRDVAIVAAFGVGAAIQIPVLALSSEQAVEPLWTGDIWTVYLQRVLDGAAFGLRLGGEAWSHLGWPFLIALMVCAVAGLAVGIKRSAPPARYLAAVAIPTSLAMFVVSLYQRAVGTQMIWPAHAYNGNGGRYAIVPALLLASVALVLIDNASRKHPGPSGRPWASMAAVALAVLAIAGSFDVEEIAGRGAPSWKAALKSAATACATEHLAEAAIPTSPPGFGVQIPCEQIASFAEGPVGR
jgi:hypothetical protein